MEIHLKNKEDLKNFNDEIAKNPGSKGILIYDLPEDGYLMITSLKGIDAYLALYDFRNHLFYLMDEVEINDQYKTPEKFGEYLFEKLNEILSAKGVDPDIVP